MKKIGILAVLGFVSVFSSGCCSYVLHQSVTATEKMGDVIGAYQHRGQTHVTFSILQQPDGYYRRGDNQRYARLGPDGSVRRYHAAPKPRKMESPLPVKRLPDNVGTSAAMQAAETSKADDTVFWWKETAYFRAHILYFSHDRWNEAQLGWDKYIPAGQYPKLIILTPFALVGDVLTFPLLLMAPNIDG